MKKWLSKEGIFYGIGIMLLASLGLLYMMSKGQVTYGSGVPIPILIVYIIGLLLFFVSVFVKLRK